jgi:hypothetical protein
MDLRLYLARERKNERDLFINGWFKMHSRTRKQDQRAGKFTVVQFRGMCCGEEEGDWEKADLLNPVIPHMHNLVINKCVTEQRKKKCVFSRFIDLRSKQRPLRPKQTLASWPGRLPQRTSGARLSLATSNPATAAWVDRSENRSPRPGMKVEPYLTLQHRPPALLFDRIARPIAGKGLRHEQRKGDRGLAIYLDGLALKPNLAP